MDTDSIYPLVWQLNLFAVRTYGGHIGLTESNIAVLSYTLSVDSLEKESFVQTLNCCQKTVVDYREQLFELTEKKIGEYSTLDDPLLRV